MQYDFFGYRLKERRLFPLGILWLYKMIEVGIKIIIVWLLHRYFINHTY